jgi:hypothetical protein
VGALNHPKLVWGIPLYADNADSHDYIVQARGAFHETVRGLYALAASRQAIEIRVVLHRQTLPRLNQLAYYIFRNFSFVTHIALMGLEPIGFARGNRDILWIDPSDYRETLEEATYFLAATMFSTLLRSISPWHPRGPLPAPPPEGQQAQSPRSAPTATCTLARRRQKGTDPQPAVL